MPALRTNEQAFRVSQEVRGRARSYAVAVLARETKRLEQRTSGTQLQHRSPKQAPFLAFGRAILKAGDRRAQSCLATRRRKPHSAFYSRFHRASGPGPHTHTSDYHGLVLEGAVHDFGAGGAEGSPLGPVGHWLQPGNVPHDNDCASTTPRVMFIYTPHGFEFIPVKDPS